MSTFRASAVATPAVRTNTTISKPTGTVDNDMMYAFINVEDDVTVTAPSGWTLIDTLDYSGQAMTARLYEKRASSEGTSYTWTHNNAGSSGIIFSVSGAKTSGSAINVLGTKQQGSSSTMTALGVTTTVANCLLAMVGLLWNWNRSVTPPSGMDERNENSSGACNTYLATATQAATGASGNKAASLSGTDEWITVLFAIEPAATVNEVAITKSLQYTVKREITAITKSLKYTVEREVAAVTKSLKYVVRAEVSPITKSLKYTVIREVSPITKTLKYTIEREVTAITKSLQYSIRPEVAITKSLKYVVKSEVAITKSLKYTIEREIAAITKSLQYTVVPQVAITKSLKYTIEREITAITKTLKYTIEREIAAITKSLQYIVIPSISITKSLKYTIRKEITAITKSLKYTIEREITAITKSLQYVVENLNTHSIDLERSSSQYLSIADASQTGLDLSTNFTLECKIKLEQLPSSAGGTMVIMAKNSLADNQRAYQLFINSADDKLYCDFYADGAAANWTRFVMDEAFVSGDVGQWIHLSVKVTIATPTMVFKKNDTTKASTAVNTTATTINNSTAPFSIGSRVNNGTAELFFDGLIDEVRVFADLRTDQEQTDFLCEQLESGDSNLKGYWKLNNNALDASGNGNHLTASGSPVYSTDVPACFNITEVAITKSLKYTIEREITAITKSLKYVIRIDTAITKSLKYTIEREVTAITKSLQYVVRGAISGLRDHFDSGFNSSLWTDWGGTSTVFQNKQFEVNSTTGAGYYGIDSILSYDLELSNITVELVDAGNQSLTSWGVWPVQLKLDSNNNLNWSVQNGTLRATKKVSGSDTHVYEVAYNAATHKYLRIREDSGTVYWDTSADGATWTNRGSSSNPFAVTALQVQIFAGTYQTEGSTTTAKFDNVNYINEPVAITKSLKYTIEREVTAITKSLQYTITPQITITKSLQYIITEAHAITKPLQYIVVDRVQITKSLRYVVRPDARTLYTDKVPMPALFQDKTVDPALFTSKTVSEGVWISPEASDHSQYTE